MGIKFEAVKFITDMTRRGSHDEQFFFTGILFLASMPWIQKYNAPKEKKLIIFEMSLMMWLTILFTADTQLFILAPLFIYPLWKSKRFGLYLLSFAAIISVVIPFYITYTQNLDPTFMIWQE